MYNIEDIVHNIARAGRGMEERSSGVVGSISREEVLEYVRSVWELHQHVSRALIEINDRIRPSCGGCGD